MAERSTLFANMSWREKVRQPAFLSTFCGRLKKKKNTIRISIFKYLLRICVRYVEIVCLWCDSGKYVICLRQEPEVSREAPFLSACGQTSARQSKQHKLRLYL